MKTRSVSWFETAQGRRPTMRSRDLVNPRRGLTKYSLGISFGSFRGHLSRPACSHVKQLAKQAGDRSDPGRTYVQAGFFYGLISGGLKTTREVGKDGRRAVSTKPGDIKSCDP